MKPQETGQENFNRHPGGQVRKMAYALSLMVPVLMITGHVSG
ncbi:MAG: hypothetical protein BWY80_01498 [Firmicutes bacterium ADurb.Bin456]|nr:MAG: hypothetical protein BWY80_01498 [Firmicutes bacterium ADurb.Bin456]